MADYLIKDTTLTNIADAIRAKKSSTDTYTPAEMATAISSIQTGGGGGELTEEDLTFTGDLRYFNYYGRMGKLIKKCGSKMRFNSVDSLSYAFYGNDPLNSDFSNWTIDLSRCDLTSCFASQSSITGFPKFQGTVYSLANLFNYSSSIELIRDDLFSADIEFICKSTNNKYYGIFSNCEKLKKVPLWFKNMTFAVDKDFNYGPYTSVYYKAFQNCYDLKELTLPIFPAPAKLKSNCFQQTFENVRSMRKFVFAPPPAGNEAVLWAKQTINLANYDCGYYPSASGSKVIYDDETYNLYKNDPDARVRTLEYSFYNHDSALETIRSLPYAQMVDIPQSDLQNVIKFYGKSGEKTDGGAINTLTAEEIAIATNKGWTVSFV